MAEKGLGLTRYPFNKLVKIVLAHNHVSFSNFPLRKKSIIEREHRIDPNNYRAGHITSLFKKVDGVILIRFIFNRYSYRKEFDYTVGDLPSGDIELGSELLRLYNESKLEVRKKVDRQNR